MATFKENLKQTFANFKTKYIGNVPEGVTVAQINTNLSEVPKNEYSETEKIIGKWINNTNIYRKVFTLNSETNISTNTQISSIPANQFGMIIKAYGIGLTHKESVPLFTSIENGNYLACTSCRGSSVDVKYIIVEYIKS